jgi:cell wall-associated NlpC family hydrolase
MRLPVLIPLSLIAALLAACGSPGPRPPASTETIAQASRPVSEKGNEIVLYAMGLLDTGYRFGGKNPEAGLDCSGMVSYIYGQAAGLRVQGSAADIARNSRTIQRDELRPGDLVFSTRSTARFRMSASTSATGASSTPHRRMARCASTT